MSLNTSLRFKNKYKLKYSQFEIQGGGDPTPGGASKRGHDGRQPLLQRVPQGLCRPQHDSHFRQHCHVLISPYLVAAGRAETEGGPKRKQPSCCLQVC